MKRTTLILATLALMLGFVSCKEDKVKGGITSISVEPSILTLTLGEKETDKLTVDWTPRNAKPTLEFVSDKPEVATVSAKGEVKAVAKGMATITVKSGDKSATCIVTVVEKGDVPVVPAGGNQLPIFKYPKAKDDPAFKEIVAHEAKMGRNLQNEVLIAKQKQGDFRTGAFVNANLDILPIVAYAIQMGEFQAIVALGKEPLDNCEKTLKMLKENGFPDVKVGKDKKGDLVIVGTHDLGKGYSVRLEGWEQKFVNVKGQPDTNTLLAFVLQEPQVDPKKFHETVADAKDFPGIEAFYSKDKDVAAIKAYEEQLGFRAYNAKPNLSDEAKGNLWFDVKEDKAAKTNIAIAMYKSTPQEGPKFMNCLLITIGKAEEFNSDAFKSYLKTNGFGTDTSFADGRITSYNKDKSLLVQAFISSGTGDDGPYAFAFMQIVATKDLQKTSRAELEALAIKSYGEFISQRSSTESFKNARLFSVMR